MPQRKKPHGLPAWEPWKPAEWTIEDAGAIQALQRGDASADQQQRALKYIVNVLAATYDGSFRPGPDGDRVTAFAEGKRHVGLSIVKLCNLSLSAFKKQPGEQP
jgi:hypothetical protein